MVTGRCQEGVIWCQEGDILFKEDIRKISYGDRNMSDGVRRS